jgi:hypothetical protein
LTINFTSAITGKIGNGRMVLYPELENGKAIVERSVRIINDNDVAVNVTLESDEDLREYVEIIDKGFILEAGEEKDAKFILTFEEEGDYEGRINVFFRGIDDKNGVALSSIIKAFVKGEGYYEEKRENEENVPITGNAIDMPKISGGAIFMIITSVMLVLVLILLIWAYNKKKSKKKRGVKNGEKKE